MGLKEIAWEGVEWTHLAQNRDQWRVSVRAVVPVYFDHLSKQLSSVHAGACSEKLVTCVCGCERVRLS
jgi:hypothetical protein